MMMFCPKFHVDKIAHRGSLRNRLFWWLARGSGFGFTRINYVELRFASLGTDWCWAPDITDYRMRCAPSLVARVQELQLWGVLCHPQSILKGEIGRRWISATRPEVPRAKRPEPIKKSVPKPPKAAAERICQIRIEHPAHERSELSRAAANSVPHSFTNSPIKKPPLHQSGAGATYHTRQIVVTPPRRSGLPARFHGPAGRRPRRRRRRGRPGCRAGCRSAAFASRAAAGRAS
ncbi:hypothetical protein CLV84_0729 [Neolewinella xylanilytica]|uniref:Uncharacterized protein n=1 Tax=Neolewinella xylanilytica TaxID=1514080 RepID=A0A2S6I8F0_9BACT|nr:hypothetical protein CLV84_0729 [Neolewinella xylanilytica]